MFWSYAAWWILHRARPFGVVGIPAGSVSGTMCAAGDAHLRAHVARLASPTSLPSTAQGLEFKHVLMADVPLEAIGGGAPPMDGAERERWELRRRELYVGMTRARDGLWVGVV
jgi:hypothetical protein